MRLSEKVATIPDDANFLDFSRSDGDSSRWPTDTSEIIDSEGQVNFMKPLGLNDNSTLKWRLGVAQGMAKGLHLPEGPTYALRDWPSGYAFYDHHKGNVNNPRHDLYLFGSTRAARFRSINEFIPHAIWLMQDPSQNCMCKYCQKTSQLQVHASMAPGILNKYHASQSPSPAKQKPRIKINREGPSRAPPEPKVYAAVQKKLLPAQAVTRSPNVHPKHTMVVERSADLRAIHTKSETALRRFHRQGELLWCKLDQPIMCRDSAVAIRYWPGLVDEHRVKPTPQMTDTGSVHGGNFTQARSNRMNDDQDYVMEASSDPLPWKTQHSTQYRMHLLAVNYSLTSVDDQLLPYQAYVPPSELITELRKYPVESLHFDRDLLSKFNPSPGGTTVSFEEAVAPYAMAMEISSALSNFWCVTDEWTFEYQLPPPLLVRPLPRPEVPATQSSAGATSLQAVLQNAGAQNAQTHASALASTSNLHNSSRPSSAAPSARTQAVSARVLGKPGHGIQTQTRFQGLWWGAERVWTGEFVRLKVPRRCIAPNGAANILPPSGPGLSARKVYLEIGRDPSELGAWTRGVFMELEALFVADVLQEDGRTMKKECRASGMLYELADEDWEDTDTQSAMFVPVPSPLNPHVAPREADTLSPNLPTSADAQLSHPTFPQCFLPRPPTGYVFRPILTGDHEAVVSLSLISGRYYPAILTHPLLQETIARALDEPGGVVDGNNLWALECLAAGYHNSVDPTTYKMSRLKMVEDAHRTSVAKLENHKSDRLMEMMSVEEEGDKEIMEVDRELQGMSMDVDVFA